MLYSWMESSLYRSPSLSLGTPAVRRRWRTARLDAREQQRVEELRALQATLTDIFGKLELESLLQTIIQRAVEVLRIENRLTSRWRFVVLH